MVDRLPKQIIQRPRLITHKILTEEEWNRINRHLYKLNESEENSVLDKRKASCRLNKLSNAIEKIKKKRTIPDLNQPRKPLKSEAKKEDIINRAKMILFENKDYARQLLRALELSTVLHERDGQLKFNETLKNYKKNLEREIVVKLQEEVAKYKEQQLNEKQKEKERTDKFRSELDKQISDKIEGRKRNEIEERKERWVLIKIDEDTKALIEEERLKDEKKREKFKKDIEEYTKNEKEIRNNLRLKEVEQEEVNKIFQCVAWKLDRMRRDREKAPFAVTRKGDEELFKEKRELLKMHGDGDKKLKEFLNVRAERKLQVLKDVIKSRQIAEEEMGRRVLENATERRRSALMRCKKDEADRARLQREREEQQRKMKNLMRYYMYQWKEKEERQRMEKEMDRCYVPDFTKENELITEHCDHVLDLVRRNRRPVYPVVAAVKDIKREFGLDDKRDMNFLKSNVPIGNLIL